MIIGFNFDGVLVDSSKQIISLCKRLFGKNIRKEDLYREGIIKKGISFTDYENVISLVYGSAHSGQTVHTAAKEVLNKLSKQASILIISSRTQEEGFFARSLLQQYYIPFDAFICTNRQSKRHVIERFDVSHYVDDNPKELFDLMNTRAKLFLLNKSYNKYVRTLPNVTRVKSLQQFEQIISLQ